MNRLAQKLSALLLAFVLAVPNPVFDRGSQELAAGNGAASSSRSHDRGSQELAAGNGAASSSRSHDRGSQELAAGNGAASSSRSHALRDPSIREKKPQVLSGLEEALRSDNPNDLVQLASATFGVPSTARVPMAPPVSLSAAGLEEDQPFIRQLTEIAQGRAASEEELQELAQRLLSDPVQTAILGVPSGKTAEDVVRERIKVMQQAWPSFSKGWREYVETDPIPTDTLWRVYIPFSQWIVEQKRAVRPGGVYVVGVYGSQGRGKTVTSRALVPILNVLLTPEEGQSVARAIDDYYLSKAKRETLKPLGYDPGPGVSNRGPAGTHDTPWIRRNIEEFERSTPPSRTEMGNFQKGIDDQPAEPFVVDGKVGVFLFDGWFNGAHTGFDLNNVPAGFKRIVAKSLQRDYKPIFDRFDALWAFDTPNIEVIEANRQQQEERKDQRAMSREAIHRFVRYFYRDSWDWENTSPIPRMEDVTFLATIDANRRFVRIERGDRPPRGLEEFLYYDEEKLLDVKFLTTLLKKELERFQDEEYNMDYPHPWGVRYLWRVRRYFVGELYYRDGTTQDVRKTPGSDAYEQETARYVEILRRLFPELEIGHKSSESPEEDVWMGHEIPRRTGIQHRNWVSVDRRVASLLAERWVQWGNGISANNVLRIENGKIMEVYIEKLIDDLFRISHSAEPMAPGTEGAVTTGPAAAGLEDRGTSRKDLLSAGLVGVVLGVGGTVAVQEVAQDLAPEPGMVQQQIVEAPVSVVQPPAKAQDFFDRMLDDPAFRAQLQENGFVPLDVQGVRDQGFRASAAFVIADSAQVKDGSKTVLAQDDLHNEAVQRLLGWVNAGKSVPEVVRNAAAMGMAAGIGNVVLLKAEPGITPEMVEKLLAEAGLTAEQSAQVVIGTPDQVKALPVLAFEIFSKKKGLPSVVVLSLAYRLQGEGEKTYTLLLMA